MITRRYRLLVALACQFLAMLALSITAASPANAVPSHITAQLVVGAPVEAGQQTQIAIRMTPAPGWHGYWVNPGDAGLGMQLEWTLPTGAAVGQPRYPVPQTLLVQGLMNHVYESEYAVLMPFTAPADAKPGDRLPVRVKAQWLACTEQLCVPERAELAAEVVVGTGAVPAGFAAWEQRLPAPLDRKAAFALGSKDIRLAIPLPASVKLDDPHVFVANDKLIDYAAPQLFARKGDVLLVTIPRAKFDPENASTIGAVLRLDGAGNGVSFTARPGPVPQGGVPVVTGEAKDLPSLAWLLLAALAGGLLLNVMPCVFPILSLKALSLARAGESESHARIEGLAYAAGVIVACLGLGALLLALRAGGEQVGWAFQLQEPVVVVALLLLAAAITANLLGVYELAVPGFVSGSGGGSPGSFTRRAFATGLLAAFVATPCTGPFMASAMGAALLLPVLPAMLLFATLGLGIALPFLAIAFVPALRARMPRPGGWMVTFRRWMALPMGLTALALSWLAWRVGGRDFLLAALAATAALLGLLAFAGRRQHSGKAVGPLVLVGVTAIAVAFVTLVPMQAKAPGAEASILDAQPFNEDALAAARRAGRPVFVYMTADWCLTCKVNEGVAIEREDTRAAFEKAHVLVLRGDWTRRDPAITRYLTAQGAAGVPLYVWYGKNGQPQQLPQVLTPSLLADKAQG
ncbi:cytochrome c biogenesis protein, transmembrane region [Novosphingobium sp. Rr 2-17]|uniref:protein-disulfide reductase DsbD family protein n=1 Tax=Novosphingobium sp. Rr 2-17 TaxID=555793 RepID=UPI0002698EC3|nr:protein-disulfide reductase DsbD domain-containing protein [Novosphingobium sp. Rr 2-17]EIZ79265.1 cytochrome c biogenesis protein, transmembrane region [Novosphingobium sp. Rr 2-17]